MNIFDNYVNQKINICLNEPYNYDLCELKILEVHDKFIKLSNPTSNEKFFLNIDKILTFDIVKDNFNNYDD